MKPMTLSLALLAVLATAPALAERYERNETTAVIDEQGVQVYQDKDLIDTPAAPAFPEADADGNGYLDRQEARDVGLLEFGSADTDGDGRIDQLEYEATP